MYVPEKIGKANSLTNIVNLPIFKTKTNVEMVHFLVICEAAYLFTCLFGHLLIF